MNSKIASKGARLLAGGLLGALSAGAALAQTPTNAQYLLTDKFVVSGGVFVLGTDVNANLNGHAVTNPNIDFDQTFGKVSDSTRGRLDALWRITPKHHLAFTYFDNSTTRSKVLDRDVTWDDMTFKLGGNVESKVKYSVYALSYEYAFVNAPNYEVAGSAGVHYADMSLQLSGLATVTNPDGSTSSSTLQTRTSNLPAPLPVIGVRGGWAVAPDWLLDAGLQVFKVNVNGYNGNWSNFKAGATWMFSRHMGVGLGYNRFATNVDVNKSNFNGHLKLGYAGWMASLTGSF
jgi:hypothetical protein